VTADADDPHVYTPRLWYPAAVAVGGLVLAAAIRAVVDVDALLVVILPVVSAFAASRALRITLSPSGLAMGKRSAEWSALTVTRTRWGETLRTPKGTPLTRRVGAYLPLYERQWREGAIGADLQRWAPTLCIEH